MHIKTSTFVAAGILAIAGTPVALHVLGGSGKHGGMSNWMKTLHGGMAGGGHSAAAPAPSSASDLTGKWTVAIESDHGPVECRMVLKQNGKKLEGTISNPHGDGDLPVTGESADGTVTFAVDMKSDHGDMHLAFKGAVKKEDGSLAGTMTSAMGESKWTAARRKD